MEIHGVTHSHIVALSRIILQQVSQHLGAGQIVDCHDLVALGAEHLTESQTADSTETVNCNFNCHNTITSVYLVCVYFTAIPPEMQDVCYIFNQFGITFGVLYKSHEPPTVAIFTINKRSQLCRYHNQPRQPPPPRAAAGNSWQPIFCPCRPGSSRPRSSRKPFMPGCGSWGSWRSTRSGDARLCLQDAFLARYLQWFTDAFTLGLHLGLSLVHDNVRRGGPQQV